MEGWRTTMRKRYAMKRKKREELKRVPVQNERVTEEHTRGTTKPNVQGVLKRFSRTEPAASNVTSLSMIKHVYADAIEYTAIARGMRGVVLLLGLITSAYTLWFAYAGSEDLWGSDFYGFFKYIFFAMSFIFLLVGIYWAIKSVRLELFRPEDEPTIFDRKNRKVYRIYRETQAGWRGLLVPWPMKMVEHDWDLIDAEHHAVLMATGSTLTRLHGLTFLVRKSHEDPTLVDSFPIGRGMQMGEITVPAAWEHIRRFMEEDGPHLPPNETLQPFYQPRTFWQCMCAPFPSFRNLPALFLEEAPMMILALLFSPIVLPVMLLLGLFTWLAYITSIPIAWKPAVREAVGEPTDANYL
jgi:uncharacterized membrane protein